MLSSLFVILGIFWGANPSHAATQVIFSKDGSKASVLMMAIDTNPDAVAFNDILTIPAEDNSGKDTKRFAFTEDNGSKSLDVMCAFSKLVTTTGSCTIVFHVAGQVNFDSSQKTVSYKLSGSQAQRLATQFYLPPTDGEVFRSSDNKMIIKVAFELGSVQHLEWTYGQP